MEIIPKDVNPHDLREEMNGRARRAGYTTRSGGPVPLKIQATVNWGEQKLNVWPSDKHGNLIE